MRKFFSLIAAVLFAGSMMAEPIVINASDVTTIASGATSGLDVTLQGINIVWQGAYYNSDGGDGGSASVDFRVYANKSMTLTAESNISKVEIAGYCKAGLTITANAGTITTGASYASETTKGTLEDPLIVVDEIGATSVTLTCTKQVRAYTLRITLEGGEVPPTPADTYTVAGSDAAIFGEAWNPALAANDMTLADGVYTWTKANLNLTVGSIEFKVVKNHSWDVAYPAQNYVLNIAEDGEYTINITFDPTTEAVAAEAVKKVIPQYEVAEAIAAGLTDNDEIFVRGIITKMEFKGKNFAKYGSVNIYVADATGAEGVFEFYNCYSLNADTFRTSTPAYDAESTAWVEFEEVADENGNAIHVGDTVIAFGKYKLYSGTHELNTGCYLTEIKHPGDAPVVDEWAEIKFTEAAAADDIAEGAVYTAQDSEFALTLHDSGNKMVIDGNDCRFGTAESYTMYNFRIKSGGASGSDKNYFTLNIPEAGTLRIAPRTGSNSATDRALIVIQGEDTLYNQIVQESQAIDVQEGENTVKVYPYVDVTVAAGEVVVRYTAGMNFYAFAFKANEPEPEVIWTVAGSKSVFGSEWSASDANNDMVKQEDGTYKWEKENITLAAGNVEFKVVKDHKWAEGYPEQNYQLAITEDGVYTISITFNAETKEITADATKTGEAEIDPTVSIAGSMNSWNVSADMMTLAEDKATASLTLNLAAQTYEFKVVLNGGDWRSNAHEFTRENATAAEMTGNLDNMHLVADVAGDYIFTWTFADNSLAITYPEAPGEEINVTISSLTNPGQVFYADVIASDGYWDIYAYNDQYEIEISNIETTEAAGTYTIDDLDANYTYIVPAEGDTVHFTAGQVVLSITDGVVNVAGQLTGDDNNIYNINLTYKDPVAEQTVNVNIPKGVLYDGYATYGLYAVYGSAEDSTYVQLAIWAEQGFQGEFTEDDLDNKYVGSGLKDAAGNSQQIYTAAITVTPGNGEGVYSITADLLCYNNTLYKVTMKIGEEQGIEDVEAAVKAIKRLVNGQLVIEKAGKTYNATGAVVR